MWPTRIRDVIPSPSWLIHQRMERRRKDRLLRRLEQPVRDPGAAWVVLLCAAGIAACLALGWVLS